MNTSTAPTHQAIIQTPIGKLGLVVSEKGLTRINFLPASTALLSASTSSTQSIVEDLHAYFESPSHHFTSPLDLQVTPFQRSVLTALQNIPVGETRTYGELAKVLKTAPRAVGNACRRNPIPVIIPCHRIIAANGIGGFAGDIEGELIHIKQCLLKHERRG